MHLNVNEIFGPTIQGEGRHAGEIVSFLRLTGCNLTCSWCDTPYTWDWSRFDRAAETRRYDIDELVAAVRPLPGRLVVSGGEPLTQSKGLAQVLTEIHGTRSLDLETNGTRPLKDTDGLWSTVTCSPKVGPSAGQNPALTMLHDSVLQVADFKFVVADQEDVRAVQGWLDEHPEVTADRVWLMPEGTTAQVLTERTPSVMEAALSLGVNFTSRLHVYGWADARGH